MFFQFKGRIKNNKQQEITEQLYFDITVIHITTSDIGYNKTVCVQIYILHVFLYIYIYMVTSDRNRVLCLI